MAPSVPIARGTQYALVIDAGSSGSRLQIYSWRDPGLERAEILAEVREARAAGLADGTGRAESSNAWWWWDSIKGKAKATAQEMELRALRRLVRVGKGIDSDEWVKRVEPGISTMSPEDIPAYLAPLMAHALEYIPPSQHAHTPIYVLATAGMRLLSDDAQQAILRATCDTLRKDYPFTLDRESDLGPCGDSVRIISGEEEGIWGWVAVNYLMDGFGHAPELQHQQGATGHDHLLPLADVAHPAHRSKHDGVTPVDVNHHSPTFGFLDMGGASTQLAFSPTKEELERSRFPPDELARVSLRLLSGELVEWPVFAASWLGFGTNRVRERYVTVMAKEYAEHDHIPDSCLPTGLRIPTPDPSKHPDFVGMGNFSDCLSALKPLLKHDAPCPAQHCLFGGLPTPHIDFHRQDQRGFIGISEYWYTANQVLGLGGVWDWAEWERSMGAFCAQDWNQIQDKVKSGSEVEMSRLQMQCFKGAWISNVLHEGIGIPRLVDVGGNDTLTGGDPGGTNAEAERRAREKGLYGKKKSHFQSMDEVDQTAISWTLGKVVLEASKAVGPVPGRGISGISWGPRLSDLSTAAWGYILIAMAAIILLVSLRRRRPRRRKAASFLSLGLGMPCSEDKDSYSYEEDGEIPKRPVSKLRLWTRRVTHALRRNVSFGGTGSSSADRRRHSSMPLSSAGGWSSQPPSPRGSGFAPSTPPVFPRSFSAMDNVSLGLAAATPPRGTASSVTGTPRQSRPSPRPRQNSNNNSFIGGAASSGGWNDPPMAMFGSAKPPPADDDDDERRPPSMLTPSAAPGERESTLSRQSSRVNLSELGLAQRASSRTSTPHIG